MAAMACDVHRAPQPGRLCGIYPALVVNGVRKKAYRRLCVPCCNDVLVRHTRDWVDQALRPQLIDAKACTSCGQVMQLAAELHPFYATLYLNGSDRRDYTALYCPDCALKSAQEFEIDV